MAEVEALSRVVQILKELGLEPSLYEKYLKRVSLRTGQLVQEAK